MKKKDYCVYTCLVGYYDSLINLSFINEDYDYICFTNQKELLSCKYYGPWEIRPLLFEKLDSTRNNRWHKILGCYELGDYISSIYIDSNIDILSNYIYDLGKKTKNDLLIPKHFVRSCIYDEIECVSASHKEDMAVIEKVSKLLNQEKMPRSYGLTENNILLRNHSSKLVHNLMCEWWTYVSTYSKRDQLSLVLVLWKNKIVPSEIMIPNARIDSENFTLYPHLNEISILEMLSIIRDYLYRKYKPFQPCHLFIRMIISVIKRKIYHHI